MFQVTSLKSDEFVTACACWFCFLFTCRDSVHFFFFAQSTKSPPCLLSKAYRLNRFFLCEVMIPALTSVGPGFLTSVGDLVIVCHCHCHPGLQTQGVRSLEVFHKLLRSASDCGKHLSELRTSGSCASRDKHDASRSCAPAQDMSLNKRLPSHVRQQVRRECGTTFKNALF